MRINVKDILSPYYDIIDMNTKKRISLCIRADDKSGYYEIYKTDDEGEIIFDKITQKFATMLLKGDITIIRKVSYLRMFVNSVIALYRDILRRYRYEKKYGRKIV